MFWKFNLLTTSHIDTLLSKENVTLQELMEEEDIIQECKAQNKSLIDFLVKPEILEELFNLIIHEPAEELEDAVRYKYSNIASELITSDVEQINDCLVSETGLLNKLYSFLETEKPLNPLLASFFSKVCTLLLCRKTEQMFEFLKSKDDFLALVLNHLGTSAIMDLVVRLVTCTDNNKLKTEILNFLNEKQLIQRLIGVIHPSYDQEHQGNAALALCEILSAGRDSIAQVLVKPEPDSLLRTLESCEIVTELADNILKVGTKESVLVNGISLLLALLDTKKPNSNSQEQAGDQSLYFHLKSQESICTDTELHLVGVKNTLTALTPRLKDFHNLLINPPPKSAVVTTVGVMDPPLGLTRLQITRLITAMLSTNTHCVNVELETLGTVQVLIELFYKYVWNNFLHTQVEQSIGHILSNAPTAGDDGKEVHHPLLVQLLTQFRLVQRILESWEENEHVTKLGGICKNGYMGHLTGIANHLARALDSGVNKVLIQEQIAALPEDTQKKWETFVTETLAEVNKIIGSPLMVTSEDPGFVDLTFGRDSTLQEMQQMTSNSIDQFGFRDDEFGDSEETMNPPLERLTTANFNISAEDPEQKRSELFEQMCSERIQPFDDADSDEDIWEDKEHDITFPAVVEARQRTLAAPERTSSEERSSSSSEDDDSPDKPAKDLIVPPLTGLGFSGQDDTTKMDVDQSDAVWPSVEEPPVAMDTGNPWDAPPSQSTGQQETGWADFGAAAFESNFADFGSSSFTSEVATFPPTIPMVVDAADTSGFKEGFGGLTAPLSTGSDNSSQNKESTSSLLPTADGFLSSSADAPKPESVPDPPGLSSGLTPPFNEEDVGTPAGKENGPLPVTPCSKELQETVAPTGNLTEVSETEKGSEKLAPV